MKKVVIIILIAMLAAPLGAEAQRRSGSKSSKSRTTSVRTSNSKKSSPAVKKAVRSTPNSKRSGTAVRSSSGSSSANKSRAVVRNSSRSSSSRSPATVRTAPRSSSSSSRNVVRTNPGNGNSRSPAVTRSTSRSTVTNRSGNTREPSSGNRTSPQARNTNQYRSTTQRPASYGSHNWGSSVAHNRPGIYHSTRRFVRERPILHSYRVAPHPRAYRARFFPYRTPPIVRVYWSYPVFRYYCRLYPVVNYWTYYSNYSITTVSAYDALFHIGEIRRVYGKVSEVYFSIETDEYFLYFGAFYPHHDFTVVIPGDIARRYSRNPEFYFQDEHVVVTGLITEYDEKPEIVVKERDQIRRY